MFGYSVSVVMFSGSCMPEQCSAIVFLS